MPSIWITSNPRPERSRAIHSFSRAADSATKRREAADFDRPEPLGAGTSPSGKRTDVDQHLVHGPFAKPVFRRRSSYFNNHRDIAGEIDPVRHAGRHERPETDR